MKTIVMGRKVREIYKVVADKDENGMFKRKPKIELEDTKIEWEEILSYDYELQFHSEGYLSRANYIYLSEDEKVQQLDAGFRADLGCWIQRVDKEIEKKDNLKKCEKELAPLLKEYNTEMIENDSEAKAYCDLHKLVYADTDYEQLISYIKPDETTATITIDPDTTNCVFYCNGADLSRANANANRVSLSRYGALFN